jgi:hypothetical protein
LSSPSGSKARATWISLGQRVDSKNMGVPHAAHEARRAPGLDSYHLGF